ncbi:MAG: ABC transporter substrate-binding protein [Actinomycetes bacterium]
MRKHVAFGAIAAMVVAILPVAVSSASVGAVKASDATSVKDFAGGLDGLVTACKKEKALNVITIPRDWANFGEAMDLFSKAFGVKIYDDNPDGSSAYEIQTIKTAPKSKQPDVVDVGASVLDDAVGNDLFAEYRVINWNDIPTKYKDNLNATYYGDYAGQIAIMYDTSIPVAPKSIKDLLKPEFKGLVAISGDPTQSQQALMSVFTAAVANGGSVNNIQPGIDFYAKMKANGNFVAANGNTTNFAAGAFKVVLNWNFNGPGTVAAAKQLGKDVKFVIPSDAVLQGTPYNQAINKNAPHPACARLWEEFMYSQNKGKITSQLTAADIKLSGSKLFAKILGGQNIFITGGATPIMFPVMVAKKLNVAPPASITSYAGNLAAVTPNVDAQNAAHKILVSAWPNL